MMIDVIKQIRTNLRKLFRTSRIRESSRNESRNKLG